MRLKLIKHLQRINRFAQFDKTAIESISIMLAPYYWNSFLFIINMSTINNTNICIFSYFSATGNP